MKISQQYCYSTSKVNALYHKLQLFDDLAISNKIKLNVSGPREIPFQSRLPKDAWFCAHRHFQKEKVGLKQEPLPAVVSLLSKSSKSSFQTSKKSRETLRSQVSRRWNLNDLTNLFGIRRLSSKLVRRDSPQFFDAYRISLYFGYYKKFSLLTVEQMSFV